MKACNRNSEKYKEVKHNNEDQIRRATFNNIGIQVRRVSKLFRHTNTKISFKTSNTIKQHLRLKSETNTNKYENSSVY